MTPYVTDTPVPLTLTVVVGLVEDVLTIVNCPVEAPEEVGSNTTLNVTD